MNFNHGFVIGRAINAIINQTLIPYELIIGDDKSEDNSCEIIEKFIKGHNWIKFVKNEKNLGVIKNGNSLLKKVKTSHVLFAAADDFLLPGYIEQAEKIIQKDNNLGLVTAPALSFHPKLGSSGFYSSSIISLSTKYYYGDEFNQTIIKFGTFYKGATSVYRADFLLENEGMGESHLSYCDTVIGTRVSSSYGCAFYPKPGAVCERFSTGYASSQMRDTSVIKSIIKSLIPLKKEFHTDLFKVISYPMFNRYLTISYSETFKILWPEDKNKISLKFISKYLSAMFMIKNKNIFLKRLYGSIKLKLNKFILNIILFKTMGQHKKYILSLVKKSK